MNFWQLVNVTLKWLEVAVIHLINIDHAFTDLTLNFNRVVILACVGIKFKVLRQDWLVTKLNIKFERTQDSLQPDGPLCRDNAERIQRHEGKYAWCIWSKRCAIFRTCFLTNSLLLGTSPGSIMSSRFLLALESTTSRPLHESLPSHNSTYL